jgi:hypothetical protein
MAEMEARAVEAPVHVESVGRVPLPGRPRVTFRPVAALPRRRALGVLEAAQALRDTPLTGGDAHRGLTFAPDANAVTIAA